MNADKGMARMPTRVVRVTLRELLEAKTTIRTSGELRDRLGIRIGQASRLWLGKDGIGKELISRLLQAFPELTWEELVQVVKAEKFLTPTKPWKRLTVPKATDEAC